MGYNISFSHIYDSISTGNTYSVSRKQRKQFTDDDAVSLGNRAKDLRDKCRALAKSDYSSGASTNIMTKFAKFIDSYNKLLDESAGSTDRTVKKQLGNMKKLIEDNEAALKKAGIDIKDDGKLKVNSEVLSTLTSSSKLKSLFGESNSFITTFQKYSDKIYNRLKFQTVGKDVSITCNVSLTDDRRTQALKAGALFSSFNVLSSMDYSDDNRNSIIDKINSYITDFNNYLTDEDTDNSSISQITAINSAFRESLSGIGITVNADNSLSLDNNIINNSPMADIKALFAKDNPYAGKTADALLNLFSDIAGASTEGLSVNFTA